MASSTAHRGCEPGRAGRNRRGGYAPYSCAGLRVGGFREDESTQAAHRLVGRCPGRLEPIARNAVHRHCIPVEPAADRLDVDAERNTTNRTMTLRRSAALAPPHSIPTPTQDTSMSAPWFNRFRIETADHESAAHPRPQRRRGAPFSDGTPRRLAGRPLARDRLLRKGRLPGTARRSGRPREVRI